MNQAELVPMCADCGHFFNDDPAAGRAYVFLYGRNMNDWGLYDQSSFLEHFEEVVLDMGNDTPDRADGAVTYSLTMAYGWPEPVDLVAAVLHHHSHQEE
jgi:hypothetical protein